ncbi:glycosyltransferase [Nonomuraea sp. NPDC050790]|uniref:glycosyltransferase n=1 Tax=Nonomuraea sp. NPDC050790 TaxID=3364371 RepID=UPI0037982CFF
MEIIVDHQWIRRLFPPLTALGTASTPVECPVTVVVLARDEERCLARCLDSAVGRGFDEILVVDTGSVDKTLDIVEEYARQGVRLVRCPWTDSFADVRNFAIETVGAGWIVFLDADEWLDEGSADRLRACLTSLSAIPDLDRMVFSPIIQHVDRDGFLDDVARIFKAESGIRYRGAVHEYPALSGKPVNMAGLDLLFHHDGYDAAVIDGKDKRGRNLRLLGAAMEAEPDSPRWVYFMIRDALPLLEHAQLLELCETLRDLVRREPVTDDRLDARHYYRRALGVACQGFAAMGDWATLHRYCDDLDRLDGHDNPDAHYFRSVAELLNGVATQSDLLLTMRIRRDEKLVETSAVDKAGGHLDALLAELLNRVKGESDGDRYRGMCEPWTDVFFERSILRRW